MVVVVLVVVCSVCFFLSFLFLSIFLYFFFGVVVVVVVVVVIFVCLSFYMAVNLRQTTVYTEEAIKNRSNIATYEGHGDFLFLTYI